MADRTWRRYQNCRPGECIANDAGKSAVISGDVQKGTLMKYTHIGPMSRFSTS